MGWIRDELPTCEGYLIAVELDDASHQWLELSYVRMREAVERGEIRRRPVRTVQVACDCGWRSPRMPAPRATEWSPYYVLAPEWFEDTARAMWSAGHGVPVPRAAARTGATAGARA